MRKRSSLLGHTAGEFAALLLAASSYLVHGSSAIKFTPAPSANLDLSQLGRVAVAGNFDSISLFEFEGQNQNSFSTNGSQSLLQQYPNGAFATLSSADGSIRGLCPFVEKNGTLAGVVVGGNFTSLGGVEAQGIALWNPDSGAITPLPGLSGQVASVYCDSDSSTVYVGGSFTGANSSNAIAFQSNWTNLPFAGFNGPVTSITKAPNGNIVFAGQFEGLGNATSPKQKDMQVIPVTSANITAQPSSGLPGFTDPKNIICKTGAQDGSGNTWLLADNVPGFWQATFQFGFVPTKLRLYNTKEQGRGTKTWRFTALPIDGILRFTYIDPTGKNRTCDSQCPLPQNNETYQDFHFVNPIGMNEFRIDISAWYGSGGGLAGIELFQDDIYAYAINDFNEPKCDGVSPGFATATSTGPWRVTPSGNSASEYLSATLLGTNIAPSSAQVVYQPNIRQSGNYSVQVFTPGCMQDNTCTNRGQVNITGVMGNGSNTQSAAQPYSTQLFQTNNFDKYDQIYVGYVDMTSDSFKPSVTLAPSAGQDGPLTVVAQRVRFELLTSTGGLNGLFEFNPNQPTIDDDFSKSAIDKAGTDLSSNAVINAVATQGQSLFVGGNFTNDNFDNIFSVGTGNPASLPGGGLNGQVTVLYQNDTLVYVGGQFQNTRDKTVGGLSGVAVYDTGAKAWRALGSGVKGSVTNIVPFSLNNTGSKPEPVLAISGFFDQVLAVGSNPSFPADGIALWDPARENWVNNLDINSIAIAGALSAQTQVPGSQPLYAGSISSASNAVRDAIGLTSSNGGALQQLPINISGTQASSSPRTKRGLTKRATANSTGMSGATTGLIYEQNGFNITAIGGSFTAKASNGSQINNLLILNGTSNSVSGFSTDIDESSTFLALGAAGNILYAGGTITGEVNGDNVTGLVLYDLNTAEFSTTQPPELQGTSVSVNAIAPQPSSADVFIGGSFTSGGSFNCPSLCIWDSARSQWNNPGTGIDGTVQSLTWADNNRLLVGGNLTVNGTSRPLTLYNAQGNFFSAVPGTTGLPGPVTASCAAASDGNSFWVAGTSSNGSSYIEKFDGKNWTPIAALGKGSVVRAIQVFMLTDDHDDTPLLGKNHALLVLGELVIPNFGNASAALFNGTTYNPFLLANAAGGGSGSLSSVFVQNSNNFFKSSGTVPYLPLP